jgi:hypothetical protein
MPPTCFTAILSILIFSSSTHLFGQDNNKAGFVIDDKVIFHAPFQFAERDTLFHTTFIAKNDSEVILATKFISDNYSTTTIRLLKKRYDEFVKGMIKPIKNPVITYQKSIKVDSLVAKTLKLDYTINDQNMRLSAVIVFIRNLTYTFEIIYPRELEAQLPFTYADLLKSIEFVNLRKRDQVGKNKDLN